MEKCQCLSPAYHPSFLPRPQHCTLADRQPHDNQYRQRYQQNLQQMYWLCGLFQ